jgi:hypothetical protein
LPAAPSIVSSAMTKAFTSSKQPVALRGLPDTRGRQPHPEAQILGITEARLDRRAVGIVPDQRRGRGRTVASGEEPWLFHRFGGSCHETWCSNVGPRFGSGLIRRLSLAA